RARVLVVAARLGAHPAEVVRAQDLVRRAERHQVPQPLVGARDAAVRAVQDDRRRALGPLALRRVLLLAAARGPRPVALLHRARLGQEGVGLAELDLAGARLAVQPGDL